MTAFAIRKQPALIQVGKSSRPVKDKSYLAWLHDLPCIVTGSSPVQAAHISYAEPKYGKLGRGMSAKESDQWAVPLCADEHRRQHDMNERAYWASVGIDPCIVAMALWASYPNRDRALLVIRSIQASGPSRPEGDVREG